MSSSDAPSDARPISCENCANAGSASSGTWPSSSWTQSLQPQTMRNTLVIHISQWSQSVNVNENSDAYLCLCSDPYGSGECCGMEACRMYLKTGEKTLPSYFTSLPTYCSPKQNHTTPQAYKILPTWSTAKLHKTDNGHEGWTQTIRTLFLHQDYTHFWSLSFSKTIQPRSACFSLPMCVVLILSMKEN